MLIDTHCHLNFKAFEGHVDEMVKRAHRVGVEKIVVPATDVTTAQKAVELAQKHLGLYAAVGLHPHHLYRSRSYTKDIQKIEELLKNEKVVAVGEVGVDKHEYRESKYGDYQWDESYMDRQREILEIQIALAKKYEKALIIHNREAGDDLIGIMVGAVHEPPVQNIVFHCCEASDTLLSFAKKHGIFIGVDGDITWSKKKQRFIKEVPMELLVLETDSPYLLPQELRHSRGNSRITPVPINEPKNITIVRDMVAKIKEISPEEVERKTTENAGRLFGIS